MVLGADFGLGGGLPFRGVARRRECRSTSSGLQTYSKNLKISELSASGLRLEYEIADLLPKVEVASSSLVTRSTFLLRKPMHPTRLDALIGLRLDESAP